jgi:hypothetical protein
MTEHLEIREIRSDGRNLTHKRSACFGFKETRTATDLERRNEDVVRVQIGNDLEPAAE